MSVMAMLRHFTGLEVGHPPNHGSRTSSGLPFSSNHVRFT